MNKLDYEWHYFIGGDCALMPRRQGKEIARIYHREQGVYEAVLCRWNGSKRAEPFPLGIVYSPDEAQEIIHQALQPLWEKA